jgi:hypothetical protein
MLSFYYGLLAARLEESRNTLSHFSVEMSEFIEEVVTPLGYGRGSLDQLLNVLLA